MNSSNNLNSEYNYILQVLQSLNQLNQMKNQQFLNSANSSLIQNIPNTTEEINGVNYIYSPISFSNSLQLAQSNQIMSSLQSLTNWTPLNIIETQTKPQTPQIQK